MQDTLEAMDIAMDISMDIAMDIPMDISMDISMDVSMDISMDICLASGVRKSSPLSAFMLYARQKCLAGDARRPTHPPIQEQDGH
jgi:hypothetical protein